MTRSEMIEALLTHASKDKGVVEVPRGSNRGPRVEAMLRTTGLRGGFAWCAAAVATWGVEALGASWPVPRTADCDVILAWARKRGVLHKSNPQRGDIFLRMASEDDAQHTGLVSEVIDEDTISAWEGNTNPGGGREGYGVFFRERSRHNLWYVRWIDAIPDATETKPLLRPVSPWTLTLPTGPFPVVEVHEGRPCSPIRALAASIFGISLEATGELIGWDKAAGRASVNGVALPGTYLNGAVGYAPVREIAEALGCLVSVNGQVVTVGPAKKELE